MCPPSYPGSSQLRPIGIPRAAGSRRKALGLLPPSSSPITDGGVCWGFSWSSARVKQVPAGCGGNCQPKGYHVNTLRSTKEDGGSRGDGRRLEYINLSTHPPLTVPTFFCFCCLSHQATPPPTPAPTTKTDHSFHPLHLLFPLFLKRPERYKHKQPLSLHPFTQKCRPRPPRSSASWASKL